MSVRTRLAVIDKIIRDANTPLSDTETFDRRVSYVRSLAAAHKRLKRENHGLRRRIAELEWRLALLDQVDERERIAAAKELKAQTAIRDAALWRRLLATLLGG